MGAFDFLHERGLRNLRQFDLDLQAAIAAQFVHRSQYGWFVLRQQNSALETSLPNYRRLGIRLMRINRGLRDITTQFHAVRKSLESGMNVEADINVGNLGESRQSTRSRRPSLYRYFGS